MDWLLLLAAHPQALASFLIWLKTKERACADQALDVSEKDIPALKGKRDSFRDIQAFVQNNITKIQRSQSEAAYVQTGPLPTAVRP